MKTSTVHHIAKLANIPVTKQEEEKLAVAFEETFEVINKLQEVDVTGVEPTHQVTGLTNVLRTDEVDRENMFTQQEALANANQQYEGYFVVPQVIDQD